MKRVLWVVDDETVNANLIEAVFSQDRDVVVLSSSNGKEFLRSVLDTGFPDLLILDLLMPEMDGFAVLDAVKERRAGRYFPVIVLSGLSDKESIIHALTMGADDYIIKPFVVEEIRARVYNMLKLKERDELLTRSINSLESALEEKLRLVESTQKEVIFRLGKAAEFRDDGTGRHIERVSHYVEIMARKMGMDEELVQMLRYASPMHDVGKIGMPDCLLLKPGKLTAQESRIMMLHTTIGAEILSGTSLPLLELAREIALSHHERWDGTGYPLKLRGEEIPLSGRIVALADVYDALTSERVYKPAWSIQEAMVYIRDQRGGQFDPAVADAFFSAAEEIVEVKSKGTGAPSATPMIRQVMNGEITIEELVEKWR
ncbi:MAG: HD domain-containing phosphohydrolase [Thermodesulfovibrionales bacterium]|jgi:putative two-component system response regulator